MKNWKLKQKFTIFLLAILLIGLTLVGGALATVLKLDTEKEIISQALILMETMNSVREYTNNQVKPELVDQIDTEFLPETIPAYSAREVFENLRQKNSEYRDFFYKEATINPSNLRDKADNFEKQLVEKFIANTNTKELTGFRAAPSGQLFYIARPIQITNESCLECHSTPDIAPRSVIERYGSVNGMGWKLNEIVGTQIISVPAKKVFDRARQSFILIMAIISLVFIVVILLVNYLLNRNVIRPLNRMARVAEEVSTGYMDAEFEQTSNDEIGNLAEAFKRMKLSLTMAMTRLSQVNRYKKEQ
jgi:HAMP domain-containing protein